MKPTEVNYFKVKGVEAANRIEFSHLNEFWKFIDENNLKNIFIFKGSAENESVFLTIFNNAIIQQNSSGFNSLADFKKASDTGFEAAATFYEAQRAGIDNFQDYQMIQQGGVKDPAIFKAMQTSGFVDGFKHYLKMTESYPTLVRIDQCNTPVELYNFAIEKGFVDYKQFINAFTSGFTDANSFLLATELGFPTLKEYEEGKKAGFRHYSEWKEAQNCGAINAQDYRHFIDLKSLFSQVGAHDKSVMLVLLSKIEQGKKISINKLTDLFKKQIGEYKYTDTDELPKWFVPVLNEQTDIINFLSKDRHIKRYGYYDEDGEFFQINLMQDREIIIDGSNVAHNSVAQTVNGVKPQLSNIIKMVNFLLGKGFPKVSVIVDASLRHKIIDPEKLGELKKVSEYLEAPRETSADMFIINHVKKTHCLLVSNDNFREWKLEDSWVAENLDYYRFSFIIKGNDVLMPDLK